jgi:hypothetical protein
MTLVLITMVEDGGWGKNGAAEGGFHTVAILQDPIQDCPKAIKVRSFRVTGRETEAPRREMAQDDSGLPPRIAKSSPALAQVPLP